MQGSSQHLGPMVHTTFVLRVLGTFSMIIFRLTRVARSVMVSALCSGSGGTCDSGRYSGVHSDRARVFITADTKQQPGQACQPPREGRCSHAAENSASTSGGRAGSQARETRGTTHH